jgi:hypothetical protein
MNTKNQEVLFIHRYQPLKLTDFGLDEEILQFIKTLILMDD